jgi:hypothetical protein
MDIGEIDNQHREQVGPSGDRPSYRTINTDLCNMRPMTIQHDLIWRTLYGNTTHTKFRDYVLAQTTNGSTQRLRG